MHAGDRLARGVAVLLFQVFEQRTDRAPDVVRGPFKVGQGRLEVRLGFGVSLLVESEAGRELRRPGAAEEVHQSLRGFFQPFRSLAARLFERFGRWTERRLRLRLFRFAGRALRLHLRLGRRGLLEELPHLFLDDALQLRRLAFRLRRGFRLLPEESFRLFGQNLLYLPSLALRLWL